MDTFELKPERKKVNRKSAVWNILTVLVLLGICCQSAYFLTIFNTPNSPLNLFPPNPLPTLFQTVTPTNTIIPLESTWTPTPTVSPVPSRTSAPTWTLPPSSTPKFTSSPTVKPTGTLIPSATLSRTPNRAATATAACIAFHSQFPGTPCP
jgi:hypothetical protein